MSNVIGECFAIFIGGLSLNGSGNVKETWCRIRFLGNKETEYKFMGKPFMKWQKGIFNLADDQQFPFLLRDVYLGGDKSQSFRVYHFSLQLEPYIGGLEFSSLTIENKRIKRELLVMREELADSKKALHDLGFEDRRKKVEIENSKHQKAVRSNYLYHDNIGGGIF